MAADVGTHAMSAEAQPGLAVTPPAPTLAAVRLARAQRDLMLRRLRPSGLIIIGVVLVISSRKSPGPGLHGESLGVLAALIAIGAGGVAALLLPLEPGRVLTWACRSLVVPGWALAVPFAALVVGSAGLVWLQPGGPGGLSAWVAAAAAMRVLPGRRSRLIGAACVAIITLAVVLGTAAAHHGGSLSGEASVLIVALVPVLICAIVLFMWRLDRDSYQIERLLIELEQAQDAEVKAAALAERQRLAREMHDVLAHSLSGLTLQLEGARLLAAEDPSDPRLADTIERAHHLAKSGLEEARRAIGMLRDEELPGPERLAALIAGFERDSGVRCELTVEGDPRELGPQARLTVYRAAQEALTNIRKHAAAARAQVRLRYEPDGIRLTVEDSGPQRGPVPAMAVAARPGNGTGSHADRGYGLAGMRERAELLGGRLTAGRSAAGFGVELWIPS